MLYFVTAFPINLTERTVLRLLENFPNLTILKVLESSYFQLTLGDAQMHTWLWNFLYEQSKHPNQK